MKPELRIEQADSSIISMRNELLQNLFPAEESQTPKEENDYILGELEDKFSQYNWFVGLALMGSRARGYNTKGSDVDLKIFYDSSEISNVKLAAIIKKHTEEIEERTEYTAGHITIPYFVSININMIKKGIQDIDAREGLDALLTIKDLSNPATGEKILKVREDIKEILSQFDDEERGSLINKVANHAINEEKAGEHKLMRRLKMSEEEMIKFWETRRQLWVEHLHGLWF